MSSGLSSIKDMEPRCWNNIPLPMKEYLESLVVVVKSLTDVTTYHEKYLADLTSVT